MHQTICQEAINNLQEAVNNFINNTNFANPGLNKTNFKENINNIFNEHLLTNIPKNETSYIQDSSIFTIISSSKVNTLDFQANSNIIDTNSIYNNMQTTQLAPSSSLSYYNETLPSSYYSSSNNSLLDTSVSNLPSTLLGVNFTKLPDNNKTLVATSSYQQSTVLPFINYSLSSLQDSSFSSIENSNKIESSSNNIVESTSYFTQPNNSQSFLSIQPNSQSLTTNENSININNSIVSSQHSISSQYNSQDSSSQYSSQGSSYIPEQTSSKVEESQSIYSSSSSSSKVEESKSISPSLSTERHKDLSSSYLVSNYLLLSANDLSSTIYKDPSTIIQGSSLKSDTILASSQSMEQSQSSSSLTTINSAIQNNGQVSTIQSLLISSEVISQDKSSYISDISSLYQQNTASTKDITTVNIKPTSVVVSINPASVSINSILSNGISSTSIFDNNNAITIKPTLVSAVSYQSSIFPNYSTTAPTTQVTTDPTIQVTTKDLLTTQTSDTEVCIFVKSTLNQIIEQYNNEVINVKQIDDKENSQTTIDSIFSTHLNSNPAISTTQVTTKRLITTTQGLSSTIGKTSSSLETTTSIPNSWVINGVSVSMPKDDILNWLNIHFNITEDDLLSCSYSSIDIFNILHIKLDNMNLDDTVLMPSCQFGVRRFHIGLVNNIRNKLKHNRDIPSMYSPIVKVCEQQQDYESVNLYQRMIYDIDAFIESINTLKSDQIFIGQLIESTYNDIDVGIRFFNTNTLLDEYDNEAYDNNGYVKGMLYKFGCMTFKEDSFKKLIEQCKQTNSSDDGCLLPGAPEVINEVKTLFSTNKNESNSKSLKDSIERLNTNKYLNKNIQPSEAKFNQTNTSVPEDFEVAASNELFQNLKLSLHTTADRNSEFGYENSTDLINLRNKSEISKISKLMPISRLTNNDDTAVVAGLSSAIVGTALLLVIIFAMRYKKHKDEQQQEERLNNQEAPTEEAPTGEDTTTVNIGDQGGGETIELHDMDAAEIM